MAGPRFLELPMTTDAESSKVMRGTKRVCPECEVRFYDLGRETIFCPSCGASYTPPSRPDADPGVRAAHLGGTTGWRGRNVRPPRPTPETNAAGPSPEVTAQDEESEPVTEIDADADLVLEQEPEDGDVSGLVDPDIDDAKEA
jgi:uncharacterized protein (TIGR02300 family)